MKNPARPPRIGRRYRTGTSVLFGRGRCGEVGYRWFAKQGRQPRHPFGHGLSYTCFAYSDLEVTAGDIITATFSIKNVGQRTGADVPQLYLTGAPGETRQLIIEADPRLLARYGTDAPNKGRRRRVWSSDRTRTALRVDAVVGQQFWVVRRVVSDRYTG